MPANRYACLFHTLFLRQVIEYPATLGDSFCRRIREPAMAGSLSTTTVICLRPVLGSQEGLWLSKPCNQNTFHWKRLEGISTSARCFCYCPKRSGIYELLHPTPPPTPPSPPPPNTMCLQPLSNRTTFCQDPLCANLGALQCS